MVQKEGLFHHTHLFTWVAKGSVRVKCLAQEHNTQEISVVFMGHLTQTHTGDPWPY